MQIKVVVVSNLVVISFFLKSFYKCFLLSIVYLMHQAFMAYIIWSKNMDKKFTNKVESYWSFCPKQHMQAIIRSTGRCGAVSAGVSTLFSASLSKVWNWKTAHSTWSSQNTKRLPESTHLGLRRTHSWHSITTICTNTNRSTHQHLQLFTEWS